MRKLPAHFAQVLALSIMGEGRNTASVLRAHMLGSEISDAQRANLAIAYGAVVAHDQAILDMALDANLDAATIAALPQRRQDILDGVNDLFFANIDPVRFAA